MTMRMSKATVSQQRYSWKPDFAPTMDPQIAGEELERLRECNGGLLTPELLIEAAMPPDAPLHPAFEWRDPVAAVEWRKQQARHLLRTILVRPAEDETATPRRAYMNVEVSTGPVRQFAYVPIDPVRVRPELHSAVRLLQRHIASTQESLTEVLTAVAATGTTFQRTLVAQLETDVRRAERTIAELLETL